MGCLSLCTCCCCLMSYVYEGILSIYLRMYINKDPQFFFFFFFFYILAHLHACDLSSCLGPNMFIRVLIQPSFLVCIYYTPRNEVVGGYTGFTMSVRPSVCPSVDKSYVVR